jgi:antitoxin component YwqK of YwqJK toxin-antitoxin module
MKTIIFTLVLLFLVTINSISAQVCVLDYIDTNVVKKSILETAINYELNQQAMEDGVWEYKIGKGAQKSILYFENSIILSFSTFKDSSIVEKEYYPNKNLKSEITFSNFIIVDTLWRPNDYGPLPPHVFIVEFKIKNGYYSQYYRNGKLKQLGSYYSNNGNASELKIGKWKNYYENGKLKSQKNYTRKGDACILDKKYFEYFNNGEKKNIRKI